MEGKGLPTGINGRNSYPGPDQRFMFCSTEWMKFHNWADQARDENGVLMTGTGGEPIAIGQLREMGRWETTLWTDSFGQQVQLYPYWSSVHKDYVLNELFPGTPSSFCNRAGALGLNYDKSLPFSLTFCPATFQLNPATIARATPLQNLFPTPGSVMLHELVHFTQAGRNTPDTCCEFNHPHGSCFEILLTRPRWSSWLHGHDFNARQHWKNESYHQSGYLCFVSDRLYVFSHGL